MTSFKMRTEIFTGSGSVSNLTNLPSAKILIICDPFMEKSGMLQKVTDCLVAAKREFKVFAEVVPDPTIEVVTQGLALACCFQPEAIVALGGGSAMDTAKVVRYLYGQNKQGVTIPLVCIPTTSGTGSEVTAFAVISDPVAEKKFALVDDDLIPEMAILDADFTLSVPKNVTADTGLDVLTHTLEAYVSTKATDFTDGNCEKAMEIIWQNLAKVVTQGDNLQLREKVHNASCLAGIAFSEASLGICHSLAHAMGGRFHIPHGRANAMLLPHVIFYNAGLDLTKELPALEKYQQAAHRLGIKGGTPKATVNLLVTGIFRLAKQLEIPKTIGEYGIDEKEFIAAIPEMAQVAMDDACTPTNPRVPQVTDLEAIYRKLCRRGEW